jgi:hypothetical protein
MAFLRFIYICFVGTGGFKSYGLLEVMGYHSIGMGYLRFDCMSFQNSCERNGIRGASMMKGSMTICGMGSGREESARG